MTTASFLGDSFIVGAGVRPRPLARYLGFAPISSRRLNWDAEYHAQGATGYVNDGHLRDSAYEPFTARAATAVANRPDIVVVSGGLNDQFHPDEAEHGARETYAAIRVASPGSRLVVIGAFDPYEVSPPGMKEAERAIRQAASKEADTFLDPQALGWLSRAGVSPDGFHPNRRGHREIANGFVAAMRA